MRKSRPWDDPKSYALSLAGVVMVALGLTVVDSLLLILLGVAVAVAGYLVSQRAR